MKTKPRSPATDVVRKGIISALEQGEASVREIEARMGFKPATPTWTHLRVLERRGIVRLARRIQNAQHKGGRYLTIWALVEAEEVAA